MPHGVPGRVLERRVQQPACCFPVLLVLWQEPVDARGKVTVKQTNALLSLPIPVSSIYFSSSRRFVPVSEEPVKSILDFPSLLKIYEKGNIIFLLMLESLDQWRINVFCF